MRRIPLPPFPSPTQIDHQLQPKPVYQNQLCAGDSFLFATIFLLCWIITRWTVENSRFRPDSCLSKSRSLPFPPPSLGLYHLRCSAVYHLTSLGFHPPSICISIPPLPLFSLYSSLFRCHDPPTVCSSSRIRLLSDTSIGPFPWFSTPPHQSDAEAFHLCSRTLLSWSSSLRLYRCHLSFSYWIQPCSLHTSPETEPCRMKQPPQIIKQTASCLLLLMQFGFRRRRMDHKLKPSTSLGTQRSL